ncbi:AAA family ATPase [Bradyrhizobium oligotrophicum]|uniref:AAA family ATPase n=1 Tax=Bradyrhizobium oligotrophicum TaxID=44255 RepID=UPI003EBF615F
MAFKPGKGAGPKTREDWEALFFEATQLFTPSTPIDENDLFAGRGPQIRKMMEGTLERGKHVILFGERGVGKTSLAKVFHGLFPTTLRNVFAVREQADPSDDFSTIWRKVFKDIHVQAKRNGETAHVPIADFYSDQISPDDVRRELEGTFKASDIPVLIIDEYDKIGDKQKTNELMANTIKVLSDYGVNVTIVLVGVADNINDLLGEHASIGRCVEQIPMPRMNISERKEILQRIVPRLGMKLHEDALWKIVHLSRGLPAYVHSLGLYSTESAILRRSLLISEGDVDSAMKRVLERSQESIKEEYSKAVHSNRSDNLYKQVLLACALADTDPEGRGTFAPLAVCKPLSGILDRPVKIDAFQQHLKKFITEERGNILVRRGHERAFRFRFREPMMQPFVIMQGIEQGLVDPSAIDALSFPAQPRLPNLG